MHNPNASVRIIGGCMKNRGWAVLVLLCLAQFMLIIDITVAQVAPPAIGSGLELDREALTWVVTAYTLRFGGLMVLGGRLADTLGARRTLLAGLAVFTAASLLCGLASTSARLIAGRALAPRSFPRPRSPSSPPRSRREAQPRAGCLDGYRRQAGGHGRLRAHRRRGRADDPHLAGFERLRHPAADSVIAAFGIGPAFPAARPVWLRV
ncbi:MFS transporter [Streptosporangium sp. CA-135522]|uniref:MFS transporter n=1 Tax=Streptosporangium sp. CA-135522 TaxID=3240072 RepID=UPI003D8EF4B5